MPITDPEAAACLAAGRGSHFLAPYFAGPSSVTQAASYLHESVAKTHYWTRRWHDLGLLEVVREVPRSGRPIKLYATVADEFVVPPDLLPANLLLQQLERGTRELHDALVHAAPEAVYAGSLKVHKPQGSRHVSSDRIASTADGHTSRGDALHTEFSIALSAAEAKAAREELEALRDKWIQRSERTDKVTHLFILAMAPVPD